VTDTITVAGNLTQDPTLRYTANGKSVLNARIAINHSKERASFFDVVAWEGLAEALAEQAEKGDRLLVTGRLQTRSWENDEGETRTVAEIVAEDAGFSLRFAAES
jgi:single-strand DNA-binding protein